MRLEMIYLEPGDWPVVERLRDFYRDVVGLSVQSEVGRESVWFQGADGTRNLGFHCGDGVNDPAAINLCFRVQDVDAEAARVKAAGVGLLNAPEDAPWGDRICTFLDPAGHTVWLLGTPNAD